jgi:hypothetical protein
MGSDSRDANVEFMRVMRAGAERIVSGDERPYDVGMSLMADLNSLFTAEGPDPDYAGRAYNVWGFLTDGVDGPPRYARGLTESEVEDLMRQAASEWLALSDPSGDELSRYFDRWDDWPDSLTPA